MYQIEENQFKKCNEKIDFQQLEEGEIAPSSEIFPVMNLYQNDGTCTATKKNIGFYVGIEAGHGASDDVANDCIADGDADVDNLEDGDITNVEDVGIKNDDFRKMLMSLDRRLTILEDKSAKEQTKQTITKDSMKKMVFQAVSSGNNRYGVGKTYIKSFLLDTFAVPTTVHYAKKINMTLQSGLMDHLYTYDPIHHLYKIK